jgi:hypothetical protein
LWGKAKRADCQIPSESSTNMSKLRAETGKEEGKMGVGVHRARSQGCGTVTAATCPFVNTSSHTDLEMLSELQSHEDS